MTAESSDFCSQRRNRRRRRRRVMEMSLIHVAVIGRRWIVE